MTELDDFLASAVASGAHVGGVAIAATGDGVVFEAGFGTTAAGGDPVAHDAPFRIASMTKALTTAACLQLVERGDIGLDDTVESIIPAFAGLKVLDGFDGDEPRLR